MSKFQTLVEIPDYPFRTGYGKNNLFMGSCFTENIGKKMQELKYCVELNPFGILYNPVSIANSLKILMDEKRFGNNDLIYHNGLWHSFYHHSRFSAMSVDETLKGVNERIEQASDFLRKSDYLFLTFGTARVYELKDTGKIVSNCHKIPSNQFREFRLSVHEIVEIYRDLLTGLWQANPGLKIVFTVSPVRHWKDGAVENQRSKSVLLLAIDRLITGFGEERCAYFPSYEIVMDELRDYRFYAEDMIHLSDAAVNHIWDRFENSLISPEDRIHSAEVLKIIKAKGHRPFYPETNEHLSFLKRILNEIQIMAGRYPEMDLKSEKEYFNNEIDLISKKLEQNLI